jgi:hypothetical protein
MKVGLVNGCRLFIGINKCHFKGPYKGVLLFIIGLDANNRLGPIAYAIMKVENDNTWQWFLYALYESIKNVVH